MTYFTVLTIIVAVSVRITCLPTDITATADLILPKTENEAAEATNSIPMTKYGQMQSAKSIPSEIDSRQTMTAVNLVPAFFQGKINKETILTTILVTNIVAVKNETAEDLNDVLYNDVINKVPSKTADPHLLEETEKNRKNSIDNINVLDQKIKIQDFNLLASLRKKRGTCENCKIIIKQRNPQKARGGGRGGGCRRGNCGGGRHNRPQQIVYQTVYQYPQSYYTPEQLQQYYAQYYAQHPYYSQPAQQPTYYVQPAQQQYHPPAPQQCTTCGGKSGGTAHAQASASASASASSSSGSLGR